MVVNSYSFLLFFVVVFFVYYLPICQKTPRFQNTWLLLVSYFFYGYADWQMIPLLLGATVVFWLMGQWLKRMMDQGRKKAASRITTFSVVLGVGLLLYFKYLNFFAESLAELLQAFGLQVSWSTLNIILPIGVSFFTFKLISYIIEIHREHIQPCSDLTEFAAYIAFFPTILSGPIDRPDKFLPQMRQVHTLDYTLAADGCRQILWGMFTKMCIADNLAIITNQAWAGYNHLPSHMLLIAALLYPIQLYADFDGYSNMAIGVGKLLGYRVNRNFNHPFLARNMAEYWRRWHMSLTGWITDYVFMPLNIAFRNIGNWGIVMAALINLIIIGLWHGANWTYGVFGLYHGLLFIPLILSGSFGKNKKLKENSHGLPFLKDFGKMAGTLCLVAIGHIIFRANTIGEAFSFIQAMVTNGLSGGSIIDSYGLLYIGFAILLLLVEWIQRKEEHALQLQKFQLFSSQAVRFAFYLFIILLILTFTGKSQAFIYFQF
ncbi:MAG: MBOAT family protein [Prevotella sp.]|nr:MBOAT family protein [Prevotella sp.]MBR1411692.1 MBOAT family protein [Prevotella sp.]